MCEASVSTADLTEPSIEDSVSQASRSKVQHDHRGPVMPCPCGVRCPKAVLVALNLAFMLCGGAILALGIWMHFDHDAFVYVNVLQGTTDGILHEKIPFVFIGTGGGVIFLSFLGCCGAIGESICFLCLYALLVFIIFAAEIVLGILVAIYKDDLKDDLESMMRRQVLFEYNTTASIANRTSRITTTWNSMQTKLECCGTLGPPNYRYSIWYNHTPENSGSWVPPSCCVLKNSDPNNPQFVNLEQCQVDAFQYPHMVSSSDFLHTRGCYWQLTWLAEENKWIFIGVIIGCAAVQLIAFVFSCCMMSCLRKKQQEYPWYDEEEDE